MAQSAGDLAAEIELIKPVIAQLRLSLLEAAGNAGTGEFMINDGQTTIKGINRNPMAIMQTIQVLQQWMTDNENKINGRVSRNVDSKNFYGRIC